MTKLLLTVRETAEALGIGRSKVYDLIRSGALLSVRIDGCRRIPASAVEEYVTRLLEDAA